jgi:ABC-2 type transport system ATP-binding protein
VELRASGRSIVLTTHYMDEAERLCDRVAIVDHGKVIALGSPRELIASLGAEHVVEFTTPESPSGSLDIDVLRALDGVTSAREHDGRWTLEVRELARAVPALLAELRARSLVLGELATHSATLEDVFVSLTGRQLRDA